MAAASPRDEERFAAALERAKLSALYQFAYGAGHDINNPLANIVTRVQTLLAGETHPERRQMLTAIQAQALRAHEMIGDLMLFARPPAPVWTRVEIGSLLHRLVAEQRPAATSQETALACAEVAPGLAITADATQLALALSALLANALESLGRGGRIELAARGCALAAAEAARPGVEIVIDDSGPGIDPAIRPHLFDPFFSGREAGRGLGFGLCKCWRIVDLHGGAIRVEASPLGGARFVVQVPESPDPQAEGGAAQG